jgi:hypothetical protein
MSMRLCLATLLIMTAIVPGSFAAAVEEPLVEKYLLEFLDEAKAILKGEKLIPFWRSGPASGVNLHRVFTDPRTFDLVLWVQGTAAAPYLQNGVCTSAATWNRLQRVFRGEFIGFALWFN